MLNEIFFFLAANLIVSGDRFINFVGDKPFKQVNKISKPYRLNHNERVNCGKNCG